MASLSPTAAPLVAGAVARVAAAAVVSPIEMFRTRMQATKAVAGTSVFRTTMGGMGELVRENGLRSLWRGLTLTMWRDVPFSGIYWWGYESVRGSLAEVRAEREELQSQRSLETQSRGHGTEQTSKSRRSTSRERHTATFVDSFVAGALSGAVASVVTTPFDVGKTRQQVAKDVPAKGTTIQRSMPHLLYRIFRNEGVAGLFRGWVARCLKVAPACAIMISSYEVGKQMAGKMNERSKEMARGG